MRGGSDPSSMLLTATSQASCRLTARQSRSRCSFHRLLPGMLPSPKLRLPIYLRNSSAALARWSALRTELCPTWWRAAAIVHTNHEDEW